MKTYKVYLFNSRKKMYYGSAIYMTDDEIKGGQMLIDTISRRLLENLIENYKPLRIVDDFLHKAHECVLQFKNPDQYVRIL